MPANIYRLKDNSIVPGTTTICGILDKPQLLNWVAKVTKEGKDWREERDSAGDIGTLVHELIMKFLYGEEITDVENPIVAKCFNKFLDWWVVETKGSVLTVITEMPFVSEVYKFGGQPDIYIPNKQKLIDVKTSNGIYESYWLQLAAYGVLLRCNGYKVREYQILWLPKDNRFDAPIRTDLRREKKIFRHLLEVYKLRRE